MSFLERMAESSQTRALAAERKHPAEALAARVARLPPPQPLQLSPQGFDLIAEVKRRSPAAGTLAGQALQIGRQARDYARGGAAGLSVLTEPSEFAGDLAHLKEAAAASRLPAMRKDFIVSPYQLLEARAAGASGVLLIVAMLSDRALKGLVEAAFALDLFVLIELFDADDVRRARPLLKLVRDGDGLLLGVNCRDLRTLQVDFGRFAALAPRLSRQFPRVAESGVESPEQTARVAELGYDVALVGTALMRAADPARAAAALLEVGRAAARPRR
jgi:indole-3-glycerol phosphate synthase